MFLSGAVINFVDLNPWMSIVYLIIILFFVLLFGGYFDALMDSPPPPVMAVLAVIDSPPSHLAIVADLYFVGFLSLILCMFLSVVKPLY